MHIALVTHKVDFQDGQGRVNYEIAMAALAQGHRVTVIAEYCSRGDCSAPSWTLYLCPRQTDPHSTTT